MTRHKKFETWEDRLECKKVNIILMLRVIISQNFYNLGNKHDKLLTLDVMKNISLSDSTVTRPPKLWSFKVFAEAISAFLVGEEILKKYED